MMRLATQKDEFGGSRFGRLISETLALIPCFELIKEEFGVVGTAVGEDNFSPFFLVLLLSK